MLVFGIILINSFFLDASGQLWLFVVLCTLTAGALALGVLLHRPVRRWVWLLLLLAVGLVGVGSLQEAVLFHLSGVRAARPSSADGWFLGGYIFLMLGIGLLLAHQLLYQTRSAWLDTGLIMLSAGMLLWTYVGAQVVHSSLSGIEMLVLLLYPLFDLLLLTMVVQLVLNGASCASAVYLNLSAALVLISDVLALIRFDQGQTMTSGSITTLQLAALGLLGVAALHPSMTFLSALSGTPHVLITSRRTTILTVLAMLGPVWLTQDFVRGGAVNVYVLIIGTLALMALGMTRMLRLVTRIQQAFGSVEQAMKLLETTLLHHQSNEARLFHQAFHDSLTDLPNRALFRNRLEQALTRRNQFLMAVLFIDLDGFKQINDTLGHDAGDQILIRVAQRLTECLRPEDTVARLGGDEFTVLLDRLPDLATAQRVAERIITTLQQPLGVLNHELSLTASIGITQAYNGGPPVDELLRQADIAMYYVKTHGKGYAHVFDPQTDIEPPSTMELLLELREALERRDFVLLFQPLYDLQSGHMVGAEALVRWNHPQRGLVLPETFMPICEESGLVVALGWLLLELLLEQVHAWQSLLSDARPFTVSMNMAAQQFTEPDFQPRMQALLERYPLQAGSLALEITEQTLHEAPEAILAAAALVQPFGVQLWLDDFGTGYSSLAYLRRLKIDRLKIDLVFIQGLGTNHDDTVIVKVIAQLATSLGLRVVAEGIETALQLRLLREIGCHQGMGFFLSPPLSTSAISTMLLRHTVPLPLLSPAADVLTVPQDTH